MPIALSVVLTVVSLFSMACGVTLLVCQAKSQSARPPLLDELRRAGPGSAMQLQHRLERDGFSFSLNIIRMSLRDLERANMLHSWDDHESLPPERHGRPRRIYGFSCDGELTVENP